MYTVTASNLCGSISYSVIVRILEDEQEYEWMAYRRSKQIIPRYFTAIVNTETSKIFKFIVQIIEAKTCVLYCNMLSRYIKGQSKSEETLVVSRCSRKKVYKSIVKETFQIEACSSMFGLNWQFWS